MRNDPGRSSADNALRLVLLLTDARRLRVTETARALGVAPSTAHRLLATLCARGFALKVGDHSYVPGPAFARLGLADSPRNRLRSAASVHLAELTRRVGETSNLVVREDRFVRFLECAESTAALRVGSRVGALLPAHCTSGGKALLATLCEEDLDRLYGEGLPASPTAKAHDLATLRVELARVRADGHAVNREESEVGVVALGTCVRQPDGRSVAAISVAIPSARYRAGRAPAIVAALQRAADGIGATL
ncbi:MAG: IclR family transcriptional regulator [Actinomycetota bacterium]|nr:IclR family transcriptional regulator [Actinomycetota bacterium]